MKKLLSLILAAILLFSLSASAFAQSSAEFNPKEEITLNFPSIWVGTDSKAPVFAEMVAAFNEAYKGKVNIVIEEQTDYQAYRDKIRTMITTGNLPDLFSVDVFKLNDLVASGKLMDFAPYLTDSEWAKTFSDGSLQEATVENQLVAIPFESAGFGLYYNTELLEKAGYTEFPKTYDEMFVMAEKLKEQGIVAFPLMTGENAWTSMLWYSNILLAVGGPEVYNRGLDDPAFVTAAEVLKKMFDYTSSDAVGAGAAVVNGHFLNFEAAVYTNGPWFLPRFAKEGVNDLGNKVKFALPPEYTGGMGTYGGMAGTVQAYLCAAKQDNPEKEQAIVEFFKFITQPEWLYKLAATAGSMFSIKLEANPDDIQVKQDLASAMAAAPYLVKHFNDQMPTAVANGFPAALDELVLGEVDAQGFVQLLKDNLD